MLSEQFKCKVARPLHLTKLCSSQNWCDGELNPPRAEANLNFFKLQVTEGLMAEFTPAKTQHYFLAKSTSEIRYPNSCWLSAMVYKLHMTKQGHPRSICHILAQGL